MMPLSNRKRQFKDWLLRCCIKWSTDSAMLETVKAMNGTYLPIDGPITIRHLYFDQPICLMEYEQLHWNLTICAGCNGRQSNG